MIHMVCLRYICDDLHGVFFQNVRVTYIGTRENFCFFEGERGGGEGGRAKIARKIILRYKSILMIRWTINILPLVFTYYIKLEK